MELSNIEKPYARLAAEIRLLFNVDTLHSEEFPEINKHEFTVYKNTKAYNHFVDLGIPFDGSWWMYRILGFDGDEMIQSLMDLLFPEGRMTVGFDSRARVSNRWFAVHARDMERIYKLFHIMGLREKLTVSRVEIPLAEEVSK